jgi:hypothetical protein
LPAEKKAKEKRAESSMHPSIYLIASNQHSYELWVCMRGRGRRIHACFMSAVVCYIYFTVRVP